MYSSMHSAITPKAIAAGNFQIQDCFKIVYYEIIFSVIKNNKDKKNAYNHAKKLRKKI